MKNKVSIVTGGSSGLGYNIAKELVARGKNVWIVGRNAEKLDSAVKALQELNPKVVVNARSMDIALGEKVAAFYKELDREYEVECLFNVAGVGIFGAAKEIAEEEINLVLNSNVKGMIVMTSSALRKMESYGGKIVNVVSTAGLKGKKNETLYCASKWGQRGFTEALKTEYKGSNILVYGIYPGGMKTAFWDKSPSFETESFMNPEEVAKQIVDVVVNESLYISDIVIERG